MVEKIGVTPRSRVSKILPDAPNWIGFISQAQELRISAGEIYVREGRRGRLNGL